MKKIKWITLNIRPLVWQIIPRIYTCDNVDIEGKVNSATTTFSWLFIELYIVKYI